MLAGSFRLEKIWLAWVIALIAVCRADGAAAAGAYDPLRVAADAAAPVYVDLDVHDEKRNREIPLRVFLPVEKRAAPVVLFSHGLGGSREGSPYLGEHWAARGYVVVYLQHAGSDSAVWQDVPAEGRMQALRQAANTRNLLLRVDDVHRVLDQLERWNAAAGHPLAGRLDLNRVGMSGHSFGAVTTQAVSGQSATRGTYSATDNRIKAAIAFSPSTPSFGDAGKSFSTVRIPWLLMTGTKDTSFIGRADVASRLAVFPALPPGNKYELVLANAEHSAFSDRALPGDREPRNPNHHRAILALSTAFWDVWLRDDSAAKAWLDGSGPQSVLQSEDRWQKK